MGYQALRTYNLLLRKVKYGNAAVLQQSIKNALRTDEVKAIYHSKIRKFTGKKKCPFRRDSD